MEDNEVKEENVVSASVPNAFSRLPTFFREKLDLWIVQVEAVFSSCKITNSKRKFKLIIAQLDFWTLQEVADLACNPSNTYPYEMLKERLISSFGQTDIAQKKMFLKEQKLDDQALSHFLREMQLLAVNQVFGGMLTTLWLRGSEALS